MHEKIKISKSFTRIGADGKPLECEGCPFGFGENRPFFPFYLKIVLLANDSIKYKIVAERHVSVTREQKIQDIQISMYINWHKKGRI